MNSGKHFYIYIHHRLDNGEVFYVGKGQRNRISSRTGRGVFWSKTVESAGGFTYEKLHEGLTESQAVAIENNYLISPRTEWKLVNKMGANTVNTILKEIIEDYLQYDETSSTCLRWKKKPAPVVIVGSEAGCKNGKRCVVRFKEKLLQVNRVVLALHGKDITNKLVDHIDGNTLNNRVENLRSVTAAENTKNQKISSRNSTGVIGVCYKTDDNRWTAQWYDLLGKNHGKSFSVGKYGKEEAFRLACEWRKARIEELNEQGAGYTSRHGT